MRASFLLLIYSLIVILVAPVLLVCWVLGLREPLMAIGRWAMLHVGCVPIGGTFELMPKGRFGAKRGTVTVVFHPPVPVDGYSEGNVAELIEKVRVAVSSGL